MDRDKLLKEIFENDPLGLLVVKPTNSPGRNEDERLVASFQEINLFYEENNREPALGGGIQEHQLYSRLKSIRENPFKIENVNVCENIKLVSTSEGLFFTQDVKVLKFPKYDREITDLSKFMLSDTDLNRYKMSNAAKKLNFDVCINSLNLLNFYKNFNEKYFSFKDFKNNELILFSKFNQLWVAKCYSLYNITFIKDSNGSFCFIHLAFVLFKIRNIFFQKFQPHFEALMHGQTYIMDLPK